MRKLIELKDIKNMEGLTIRANDIIRNCQELEQQGYNFKSAEMKEQIQELKQTIEWINERISTGFYAYMDTLEELRSIKDILFNLKRSLTIGAR